MQIQTRNFNLAYRKRSAAQSGKSCCVFVDKKNEYETISVYHACTTAMSNILQFTFSQKQKSANSKIEIKKNPNC